MRFKCGAKPLVEEPGVGSAFSSSGDGSSSGGPAAEAALKGLTGARFHAMVRGRAQSSVSLLLARMPARLPTGPAGQPVFLPSCKPSPRPPFVQDIMQTLFMPPQQQAPVLCAMPAEGVPPPLVFMPNPSAAPQTGTHVPPLVHHTAVLGVPWVPANGGVYVGKLGSARAAVAGPAAGSCCLLHVPVLPLALLGLPIHRCPCGTRAISAHEITIMYVDIHPQ